MPLKHSPRSVYLTVDGSTNWPAWVGIGCRGVNHLMLIVMTAFAFTYAAKGGINIGIIASLFTIGVFFTAVIFYFTYGEKLTLNDFSGMLIIVLGTCMVGFGSPPPEISSQAEAGATVSDEPVLGDDAERGGSAIDTWLAIFFAILTGLCFSLNSFVMKYYVDKIGFTPFQLNMDGYMVCNIFLTAGFFYMGGFSYYDTSINVKAMTSSFLSLVGTTAMTIALQTGKGGPIQAIDSLKSSVPLLLNVVIYQDIPNYLQIGGFVVATLGAGVMAFKSKSPK